MQTMEEVIFMQADAIVRLCDQHDLAPEARLARVRDEAEAIKLTLEEGDP